MDELQRRIDAQADKLGKEFDGFDRMMDHDINEATIALMLSQAKRVRREAAGLVRELARLRDHLVP